MPECAPTDPSPHLLQEAIDRITAEFDRPTELSIDYETGNTSKTATFTVESGDERVQYVLSFTAGSDEDADPTIERR